MTSLPLRKTDYMRLCARMRRDSMFVNLDFEAKLRVVTEFVHAVDFLKTAYIPAVVIGSDTHRRCAEILRADLTARLESVRTKDELNALLNVPTGGFYRGYEPFDFVQDVDKGGNAEPSPFDTSMTQTFPLGWRVMQHYDSDAQWIVRARKKLDEMLAEAGARGVEAVFPSAFLSPDEMQSFESDDWCARNASGFADLADPIR